MATNRGALAGADSRRKGQAGERERARRLGERLGVACERHLAQARQGGHDRLGLTGWALEVKRAKVARVEAWWRQTLEQAKQSGQRPALGYRLDRGRWHGVIDGHDRRPDLWPRAGEARVILSRADVCTVARRLQTEAPCP